MQNLDLPKLLPTAVVVALTLMIWFVIPVPAGVSPNAWHLFALFVGTIAGIIGNAMPLGALSIIAITSVAVTGVTNPGKPAAAVVDALSGFANPLIWLIVIAVMVAMAVLKTGLGRRIGYHFVRLLGTKTIGVAYGLVLSELVIAPVTPSNTARGGAIIHPIMRSIADSYGSSPELGTTKKIGRYLALVNYNINPITSAMFITATAPNPLCVALIAQATGSSIHITWGQWALAALLPCLCMLLVMPLVLYFLYPPEIKQTPGAKELARTESAKLGPMCSPGKDHARGSRPDAGDLGRSAGLAVGSRIWPRPDDNGRHRPLTAAHYRRAGLGGCPQSQERLGHSDLVCGLGHDGHVPWQPWPDKMVFGFDSGQHHPFGTDVAGIGRYFGPDLLLRPLFFRQHHGACDGDVHGLLRRRHCARYAAYVVGTTAGVLVLTEHVLDSLTPLAPHRSFSDPVTPP